MEPAQRLRNLPLYYFAVYVYHPGTLMPVRPSGIPALYRLPAEYN